MSKNVTIINVQEEWMKLESNRNPVLTRARECSALTIPSLLPEEGVTDSTQLSTPWQSFGARGVNNLASKLILAILPPNSPFFRLSMDDFTLLDLTKSPEARAEVDQKLNSIERSVQTWIETKAFRVPVFEALKLLIVTGNALLYLPEEGGAKVYRLDQYVVKRDPMGNVLEIITKEKIHPSILPEEIRGKVSDKLDDVNATVDLYTRVYRNIDLWEVQQEVDGNNLPKSSGTYPLEECPWIVLRWSAGANQDYGRGIIEEYQGDLKSLEGLTKAIVQFAAMAAKVVPLINPNGLTNVQDLNSSNNGQFVAGLAQDVTFLQIEKQADFNTAWSVAQNIETRLARAFLMMESIQRDAERVTSEEIRTLAKELEDSLGGVYSVLSLELQLPLVNRVMSQMTQQKKLPELPKGVVKPMITTGLEALGRGNDLNKLLMFKQFIMDIPGAPDRMRISDFMIRVSTSLGFDANGLFLSEEEFQQNQQATMMQGMMGQVAPGVAQEITKGYMQNANNQEPAQE